MLAHRFRIGENYGDLLEGNLFLFAGFFALAVGAIQQDQAVGVNVDAGLRIAALVSSNVT